MSKTAMRTSFKQCIHLLESHNLNLGFCIKFREWLSQCPIKCQEFTLGEVGKIAETNQKKFNIECINFVRRNGRNNSKVIYYCTLMKQEDPICDSCLFPDYNENI